MFKTSLKVSILFILPFVLSVLVCSTLLSQALPDTSIGNILITYPEDINSYKKISKINKARFQLDSSSYNYYLKTVHLTTLPKQLKKIQLQVTNDEQGTARWSKHSRNLIEQRISDDQELMLKKGLDRDPKKIVEIKNFIEGRPGSKNMPHQWHSLTSEVVSPGERISQVRLKLGLFKKITMATTALPTTYPARLPAIDNGQCKPIDRLYERKKLAGYGEQNIKYKPYYNSERKISQKTFSVYFEKNRAEVKSEDIREISMYLKENGLSIVKASIAGYSSVEGDSSKNVILYKKRAQHLIKLLEKKNNEAITLDTLILSESWEAFRAAIRKTAYSGLDTLSNTAIRNLINNDPALLNKLEDYLKVQRKASVQLVTAKILTTDEILQMVRNELTNLGFKLNPNFSRLKDVSQEEARAMGVFKFYDKLIEDGKSTYEDLAIAIDENVASSQLTVLLFYHFIKTLEEKASKQENVLLDSIFRKRKWNNLFIAANNDIIALIKSDDRGSTSKRIRQAVDIQYYTYKYIEQGILDPNILCALNYPQEYNFYALKLQQYAMLQILSQTHSIDCINSSSGEQGLLEENKFGVREFTEFIRQAALNPSSFADTQNSQPKFDSTQKGDYYYFLKTLFLDNDNSIQQFVNTSDNMVEFDLYHLLSLTVDHWDPFQNYFHDKDIQLKQMDQLIRKLKSIDGRICDKVVNQLYLDYHLKAMHHLQIRFMPGDVETVRISDESLKFVADYYSSRTEETFSSLSEYVVYGLNYFYWLPSKKPSTQYAYTLVKSLRKHPELVVTLGESIKTYEGMYGNKEGKKRK